MARQYSDQLSQKIFNMMNAKMTDLDIREAVCSELEALSSL